MTGERNALARMTIHLTVILRSEATGGSAPLNALTDVYACRFSSRCARETDRIEERARENDNTLNRHPPERSHGRICTSERSYRRLRVQILVSLRSRE